MKHITTWLTALLLLFITLAFTVPYSAPLNVTNYGATGNGTTDDATAINSALAAAHSLNKSLYFPPGTYLCNTTDTNERSLNLNLGGNSNITIYGGGGATIITSDTGNARHPSILLYIYSFSASSNITVTGLRFINTHVRTNQGTAGVFITGTDSINVTNLRTQNCTFSGFGTDLSGQGINGWSIKYDSFPARNGHDDAYYGSNSNNPAVNIWLYDNGNGYNINVTIANNWAWGWTGTPTARRPMDGFVYGYAYGLYGYSNFTKYFCQEHWFIQPPTTFPGTSATVALQYNTADCSLPPGITDDNGSLHKYDYGFRCDAPNTTTTNNTLINPAWGIMSRPVDYSSYTLNSWKAANNTIFVPQDTNTVIYQGAIYLSASSGNPMTGVTLTGNGIWGIDTIPVQLFNVTSPVNNNSWGPVVTH